ncbi:hypothetical protein J4208_02695 [Candidatus Woesearchaeota archaeon]|nr:hypothetical protein [Candidatus Woesearchaeota archaeon]
MQKEVSRIPWISIALVFIAIVTVGIFMQPSFDPTGALVYRDYSYGGGYGGGYGGFYGGGQLSITNFYEEFHVYIDSIIFLIIFLSIGKAVFLKHFNTGGKSLYVAVGLALTLGLMIWEERQGIYIIYELGPVGIIVLLAALLAGIYYGIFKATEKHWAAVVGTLLAIVLLTSLFNDLQTWLCTNFYWLFDCNQFSFSMDLTFAQMAAIGGFLIIGSLIWKGWKDR